MHPRLTHLLTCLPDLRFHCDSEVFGHRAISKANLNAISFNWIHNLFFFFFVVGAVVAVGLNFILAMQFSGTRILCGLRWWRASRITAPKPKGADILSGSGLDLHLSELFSHFGCGEIRWFCAIDRYIHKLGSTSQIHICSGIIGTRTGGEFSETGWVFCI